MTEIILKIRNLLEDNLRTDGVDVFTYESTSSSKIFSLTKSNVSSASIIVYKNGVIWASSNYSYSAITGKLTVTGTLTAGNTLEVNYSYYEKYSDTELQGFIRATLTYLSTDKYKTFTCKSDNIIFPTPDEAEENLIALIATILIKGDIVSYRTPEITINFERGDSKEKKISKIIRKSKKCFGVLGYVDLKKKIGYDNSDDLL